MANLIVGSLSRVKQPQARSIARDIEQELGGPIAISVVNQMRGIPPSMSGHWQIKATSEKFSQQDLEEIEPEIRVVVQDVVERYEAA